MATMRIPKHLREQAEAAQAEFKKPENKAARTITRNAAAEVAEKKPSRASVFKSQAMPAYQTKELMRTGLPSRGADASSNLDSGFDVDEAIQGRREGATQIGKAVSGSLAHFDLAEDVHNSLSHSVNSLYGAGGSARASKEDPDDSQLQKVHNLLHKARTHLDAHWESHSDDDAAGALAHMNKFSEHMTGALAAYTNHPKAENTLGRSNASIQATKFGAEGAHQVVRALPGLYAQHVNDVRGEVVKARANVTAEDSYGKGERGYPQVSPMHFGDPKKGARVPRPRKKTEEIAPISQEELVQRKAEGDKVVEDWVGSIESNKRQLKGTSDYKARERIKRGLFKSTVDEKTGYEETPKSEQPNTKVSTAPVARTPLEEEHDSNVRGHRDSMISHHTLMAIAHGLNGADNSQHMSKLPINKQNKVNEMVGKYGSASNKSQIVGRMLSEASAHKTSADNWYVKAQNTQKQMNEEQ